MNISLVRTNHYRCRKRKRKFWNMTYRWDIMLNTIFSFSPEENQAPKPVHKHIGFSVNNHLISLTTYLAAYLDINLCSSSILELDNQKLRSCRQGIEFSLGIVNNAALDKAVDIGARSKQDLHGLTAPTVWLCQESITVLVHLARIAPSC